MPLLTELMEQETEILINISSLRGRKQTIVPLEIFDLRSLDDLQMQLR